MSAFASNPGSLSGWFDWFGRNPDGPPNETERAQIADAIVRIPAMANQIAAYRRQVMAFRGKPVDQAKVMLYLGKIDQAERSLRALDGMARLAWKAAFRAGKVELEAPYEAEVGMSGVFAWVAIGIAGAGIIAAFFIAVPAIAIIVALTGLFAAIAAGLSILAEDNAAAMANRKPGDPPVPSIVSAPAATVGAFSLLPLLAIGGAGLWLLTRRRSR